MHKNQSIKYTHEFQSHMQIPPKHNILQNSSCPSGFVVKTYQS